MIILFERSDVTLNFLFSTEKFEDVDINNAMEPFLTAERDR